MKVSVSNYSGYTPEEPLEKAWYEVSVNNATVTETRSGRMQLVLDLVVEDGPEQSDGSSPAGRQLRDYILLSTDGMQDTGVRLTLEKQHNTFDSFGVEIKNDELESDDFIGKTAMALVKPKADNDGIMRANIVRYKAT